MPIIPLKCPSCGGQLTVDSEKDAAICNYCGNPYVVKDAIVKNYITNVTNINADTVNIINNNQEEGFEILAGVLLGYTGSKTDVVIPNTVKRIGKGAFKDLPITSVVFSKEVTVIQEHAFENCTELNEIVFNEGLVEIEKKAFGSCTSITQLLFPDSLRLIGESAFELCKNIHSIRVSASIEEQIMVFPIDMVLKEIILSDAISYSTYINGIAKFGRLYDTITITGSPEAKSKLKEFQVFNWKNNGVCAHCGGYFTGIRKKCSYCGIVKDY